MSISSILFQGESDDFDSEANQPGVSQPERPPRSLRRMLKPWPFHSAPQPVKMADDEDDEDYRESTPAAVLDRLAQFADRR